MLSAVLEQVTARSQGVLGYVKLLGLLVQRYPNLLLGKAAAVQDVFGYISVLPPTVAERFLQAVSPLMRLRPGLQVRRAAVHYNERWTYRATTSLVFVVCCLRVSSCVCVCKRPTRAPFLSCCRRARLVHYRAGLSRRCFRVSKKGAFVTTRLL